ncbi:hypothetical protein, partial [Ruegeria arenilitoris]|uniref:hypothetical protein n=1 Tax=Ruegeria arenilitoris TaxID=1173585 RepID=UPI001480CC4F
MRNFPKLPDVFGDENDILEALFDELVGRPLTRSKPIADPAEFVDAVSYKLKGMQGLDGTNVISFPQELNPSYQWGVTGLMTDETPLPVALALDVTETGSYGQGIDGQTDDDGRVDFTFQNNGTDLTLNLTAYDIDHDREIEWFLNGVSQGFLSTGIDNGFSQHNLALSQTDMVAGTNTITFVQTGETFYLWGVKDLLLEAPAPAPELVVGVTETGSYGQGIDGQTDDDGRVEFSFQNSGTDLTLNLTAFDIDHDAEIEWFLNGVSQGFLSTGIDNGYSQHNLALSQTDMVAGTNTVTFVQTGETFYLWGVKDLLLEAPAPAPELVVGDTETGSYGQGINGATDADGQVHFTFQDSGTDLTLSLTAFDIDSDTEVEWFLNGVSQGFLSTGFDNGFSQHNLSISSTDLVSGANTLTFVQTGLPTHLWGVTNLLLENVTPPPELAIGVTEMGSYGQGIDGQTDADGQIDFTFQGTGDDLVLNFTGYDIDSNTEIEWLLNGVSQGFLTTGIDNGFSDHSINIPGSATAGGTNTITFVQTGLTTHLWGVTDLTLYVAGTEPVPAGTVELVLDVTETGSYGQGIDGQTDDDGRVDFAFQNTGTDLTLNLTAFDIDSGTEVEWFLNGASQGFLTTGVDNGFSQHALALAQTDLVAGTNTITFVQTGEVYYLWGVKDLLLEAPVPPPELAVGVTETGSYGQGIDGQTDADGQIDFTFQGTGDDLVLNFTGYDIDSNTEIEWLLNGVSQGFLTTGIDNGFSDHSINIPGSATAGGTNTITFVQTGLTTHLWGVTDLTLYVAGTEPVPAGTVELVLDVTETGSYGQGIDGQTDDDGRVDFAFQNTGTDLTLNLTAFDIDSGTEVEWFLNGASQGFLTTGVDNGFSQ